MAQHTSQPDVYEGLRMLVEDTTYHEEQCRDYLQYAKYLLFREFRVLEFINFDAEYRLNSGDVDVAVSGRIREEDGSECNRAYVWELKAPQCTIFKRALVITVT